MPRCKLQLPDRSVSRVNRNPPNKKKPNPCGPLPVARTLDVEAKPCPLGHASCRRDAGTQALYGQATQHPAGADG